MKKKILAIALGLGTLIGWRRIVITVGEKIGKSHLTYAQGAAAEWVTMGTIAAAEPIDLQASIMPQVGPMTLCVISTTVIPDKGSPDDIRSFGAAIQRRAGDVALSARPATIRSAASAARRWPDSWGRAAPIS